MLAVLAGMLVCGVSKDRPQRSYYGMYIGKVKWGYGWSDARSAVKLDGQSAFQYTSSYTTTVISDGVPDTHATSQTDWYASDGRWLRQTLKQSWGGKQAVFTATRHQSEINLVIQVAGRTMHRSLRTPEGLIQLNIELTRPGREKQFRSGIVSWDFDAPNGRFIKCVTREKGRRRLPIIGAQVVATEYEIVKKGITSNMFVDNDGQVLLVESALQSRNVLQPKSKATATPTKVLSTSDLRELASIPTAKPIGNASRLSEMKIRISGEGVEGIPSDPAQTVTQDGNGWIVEVHPRRLADSRQIKLEQASKGQERWLSPITPASDSNEGTPPKEAKSAKEVISHLVAAWQDPGRPLVSDEASFHKISPIADQKVSDYCVNKLRVAGVPARTVMGYALFRTRFMRHYWVEAWDGQGWIGLDPLMGGRQIGANHIKFTTWPSETESPDLLDPARVRIRVLNVRN